MARHLITVGLTLLGLLAPHSFEGVLSANAQDKNQSKAPIKAPVCGAEIVKKTPKKRHSTPLHVQKPQVSHCDFSTSPDVIKKVILKDLRAISTCLQRTLNAQPRAYKVTLSWVIQADGSTTAWKIDGPKQHKRANAFCMLGYMKQWRFPKPVNGQRAITYPLHLEISPLNPRSKK